MPSWRRSSRKSPSPAHKRNALAWTQRQWGAAEQRRHNKKGSGPGPLPVSTASDLFQSSTTLLAVSAAPVAKPRQTKPHLFRGRLDAQANVLELHVIVDAVVRAFATQARFFDAAKRRNLG